MKTLFGFCDEKCAEKTLQHITKVENTNERMIHVIRNQKTVVKSAIQIRNNGFRVLNGEQDKYGSHLRRYIK